MRLIDADEFKKQIAGMAIVNNYPADKVNKMCKLIDCQPTVYDVDKAVERLMCESVNCHIMTYRAVEIVKSGGID